MSTAKHFFSLLSQVYYRMGNLYIYSVDEEGNPYGDWPGDVEERHYLADLLEEEIGPDYRKIEQHYGIEEIIPLSTSIAYISLYKIVWKHERRIKGMSYILGFMEASVPAGEGVPKVIRRTDLQSMEKNLEDILSFGHLLLDSNHNATEALQAQAEAEEERSKVEGEYRRSSLMAEIMQQLNKDGSLRDVFYEIFEKICTHMEIEEAKLYEIAPENQKVVEFVAWGRDRERTEIPKAAGTIEEYPFMNGLTYTISGNSTLSDEWRDYLKKEGIHAMVSMPLLVKNEAPMYVVFQCRNIYKNWSLDETRFLHDLKKIMQSIVAKKMTQRALYSSLNSMEQILNNMGCNVFAYDPQQEEILFHNDVFGADFAEKLMKLPEAEALLLGNQKEQELFMKEDGAWYRILSSEITWVNGKKALLFTVDDITKLKEYEKEMEISINSDLLTGLYNRVRCEADIRLYLEMTKNYGGEGALFFIDLDDFKHINDGLGHQYGDILLKEISADLRKIPGIESTCYRVGGDEFMVIVANNVYDRIGGIVTAIEDMFAKPWFLKNSDYYCTMSMGVCRFPTDADNVEDIIRKADVALQEAKKSGKNRVEYYDSNVTNRKFKRLDMENFMRKASINPSEEFEVVYQPIFDVSLEGSPCVGAEALLRWNSKTMGHLAPEEFIPLAEYLGLITPIGYFVLEEACRHCKFWNDMGHPEYKINVNFSVVQLLQGEIVDSIRRVLARTGLNPHNLTIEVTESLAVNDMTYMTRILEQIKSLGVRIALDDFGTGYSSLNHIRQMPLDIIKIDRCFIEELGKDAYSDVFVKMVSELSKTMGLNLCVEGVETKLQFDTLKEIDVNLIQGFYFSKPISIDEFEERYLD